jgi:hypothetical protein
VADDEDPFKCAISKDGNLIYHYIKNDDLEEFTVKIIITAKGDVNTPIYNTSGEITKSLINGLTQTKRVTLLK